jgi:hypothetical protein
LDIGLLYDPYKSKKVALRCSVKEDGTKPAFPANAARFLNPKARKPQ